MAFLWLVSLCHFQSMYLLEIETKVGVLRMPCSSKNALHLKVIIKEHIISCWNFKQKQQQNWYFLSTQIWIQAELTPAPQHFLIIEILHIFCPIFSCYIVEHHLANYWVVHLICYILDAVIYIIPCHFSNVLQNNIEQTLGAKCRLRMQTEIVLYFFDYSTMHHCCKCHDKKYQHFWSIERYLYIFAMWIL